MPPRQPAIQSGASPVAIGHRFPPPPGLCYASGMTARLGRIAAFALLGLLAACGGGDKPWHTTDITGSMPKLQFRMQRANDASIVSEQNYKGRVVILYFGYTHCP